MSSLIARQDVDGRVKPGHDDAETLAALTDSVFSQ